MVEKKANKIDMLNYEVIVSIKKEKYFCRIPELSLVAKGNDLESSYQELMKKKEEFIKEVEEFEIGDEFIPPSTTWFRESRGGGRGPLTGNDFMGFLMKTGVVGLMALVILYIATQAISGKVNDVIDSSLTKGSGQIESTLNRVDGSMVRMVENVRTEIKKSIPSRPGNEIENALYKAVDHPIDPEREQKIIESIRVVVNRLKPFAKEFRPLLEEIGLAGKKELK